MLLKLCDQKLRINSKITKSKAKNILGLPAFSVGVPAYSAGLAQKAVVLYTAILLCERRMAIC